MVFIFFFQPKNQSCVHLVCSRPTSHALQILRALLSMSPKDIRLRKDAVSAFLSANHAKATIVKCAFQKPIFPVAAKALWQQHAKWPFIAFLSCPQMHDNGQFQQSQSNKYFGRYFSGSFMTNFWYNQKQIHKIISFHCRSIILNF